MEEKVSVIITVRNAEDRIARCLDSILAQSYNNLEVICVFADLDVDLYNLLVQYQQFDSRIKLIESSFSNIATMRNLGIDASTGKYILFVEANDFISSIAIETLWKNAEKNNSDIVIFDFVYPDCSGVNYSKITIPELKNYFKDIPFSIKNMGSLSYRFIPVVFWTKFYRADLIKNKIKFYEDIRYSELPFWTEVYLNAEKITYIPDLFYSHYIEYNKDRNADDETVLDIIKSYKRVEQLMANFGYWEKYKPSVLIMMVKDFIQMYNVLKSELKEVFFNAVKDETFKIQSKLYDSDDYTDSDRTCVRLFNLWNSVDYQTYCKTLLEELKNE